MILKGVAACGQRMLIAAMRTSFVALLFLVGVYLSHEIVTLPKLGVYSSVSSKQIAMRYEAPQCGYNATGLDVGGYNATAVGGFGGIGQYLILSNSRGETDLHSTLRNFKADIYRIEIIGATGASEVSVETGNRRKRSVYYEMQSAIMFLMPPFLLRAFTLGVLWPSLGRLLVNVQNDNCTTGLVTSHLEHIAAAAVTAQLMDALDREGGTIGYRHELNGTAWHRDTIDWNMFDCMTYDEEPWDVPSVRVSRLEWVTCSERSPEWSKPTVGFFVLDLFLSLLFVGFIFTALHRPFMTIVDELADHEVKELQDDIRTGNFPSGAQLDIARSIFDQFDDNLNAEGGEDKLKSDDINLLTYRPLMLIDFIVSDPINCMFVGPWPLDHHFNDKHQWVRSSWAPFGDALVSAFFHWVFIIVVGMPLVFLAMMLGCKPEDEYEFAAVQCSQRPLSSYILYFLWIKDLFGFLYCATHYLQLEGPRKKQVTDTLCGSLVEGTKGLFYTLIQLITVPVRWIALLLIGMTAVCSAGYMFNVISWMVLTILLKPSIAITAITLLAVPVAYAFFSFMALQKMQQAILGSKEVKNTHATLKRYGLRTQDIIMAVLLGLILIVTLVVWCVLGFALFTNSLDNPASIVPALGLLGGSASGAGKDVQGFQKKIDSSTSGITGQFHAVDDVEAAARNMEGAAEAELATECAAGIAQSGPSPASPTPPSPEVAEE